MEAAHRDPATAVAAFWPMRGTESGSSSRYWLHGGLESLQDRTKIFGEIAAGKGGKIAGKAVNCFSHGASNARQSVGIAAQTDGSAHGTFPVAGGERGGERRWNCTSG
jgi:hypothetical protein